MKCIVLLPGEGCWQIDRKEIREKKLEGHKWIIPSQEAMPSVSSLWKNTISTPRLWLGPYNENVYSLSKEVQRVRVVFKFGGAFLNIWGPAFECIFSLLKLAFFFFFPRVLNFYTGRKYFLVPKLLPRCKIPTLCSYHLMLFINSSPFWLFS